MNYKDIYIQLENSITQKNKKNIESILFFTSLTNVKGNIIKNLFKDYNYPSGSFKTLDGGEGVSTHYLSNGSFNLVLEIIKGQTLFYFQYIQNNMELKLYDNSFSIKEYEYPLNLDNNSENHKISTLVSSLVDNSTIFYFNDKKKPSPYTENFMLHSDEVFKMLFNTQKREEVKDIYKLKDDIDLDNRFNFSNSHNLVNEFIKNLKLNNQKKLINKI